jgi:hypothetical protein
MTPDPWPSGAAFQLELLQERVYTDLARRMGLKGPRQAYEVFADDPVPSHLWENQVNEELESLLGKEPGSLDIKGAFSGYREKILTLKPPTPYESPALFYVLAQMVHSIRQAVSADDLRHILPPPLIFGTLPTGQVNARAVLMPGADYYLVLFESGLFSFANEMAKIIAQLLPPARLSEYDITIEKPADPDLRVDANPAMVDRFDAVLRAYVVEGNPRRLTHLDIALPYKTMAVVLLRTMELFVLGHELGHLIARHLLKSQRVPSGLGAMSAERVQMNWDQEHEADHWGFNYLMAVEKPSMGLKLCYSGCDLFFSCIRSVERCLNVLQFGPAGEDRQSTVDTHPPVAARREYLRTVIQDIAPRDEASECIGFGQALEGTVEALWRRVGPRFQRMHAAGVRPSVAWVPR